MTIFVHSNAPEQGEVPLRQRRPHAAAVTEFGTALNALEIKQRSAARWFDTSERNIRRWKSGDRRTPPAVGIVFRLLVDRKITVRDVEEAAALGLLLCSSVSFSRHSGISETKRMKLVGRDLFTYNFLITRIS